MDTARDIINRLLAEGAASTSGKEMRELARLRFLRSAAHDDYHAWVAGRPTTVDVTKFETADCARRIFYRGSIAVTIPGGITRTFVADQYPNIGPSCIMNAADFAFEFSGVVQGVRDENYVIADTITKHIGGVFELRQDGQVKTRRPPNSRNNTEFMHWRRDDIPPPTW